MHACSCGCSAYCLPAPVQARHSLRCKRGSWQGPAARCFRHTADSATACPPVCPAKCGDAVPNGATNAVALPHQDDQRRLCCGRPGGCRCEPTHALPTRCSPARPHGLGRSCRPGGAVGWPPRTQLCCPPTCPPALPAFCFSHIHLRRLRHFQSILA